MREKITYLGGSSNPESIGKQCTVADLIVKVKRKSLEYRVMIDCGMEFVREEVLGVEPIPNFSKINDRQIDCVLETHGHADHTGALGALRASGLLKDAAPIISSPQTAYMLELSMKDGLRGKLHNPFDMVNILKRRTMVPKPGLCEVLPGLVVFFEQNGHLSGSTSMIIPTGSGKKGLIIGDASEEDQPITGGRQLPSQNWSADWIPDQIWGTDFTYSFEARASLVQEVTKLQNQARIDILAGKKIVVGAFRAGRGQNIPMWLREVAWELRVPIWLDGSISTVWNILRDHPWSDRDGILPELGEKSGIIQIRDSMHRMALLEKDGPAIFVTTPGMADFRPLIKYLEYGLPRKNFTFYFTSWVAKGTNADRILSKYQKIQKAREAGDLSSFTVKIKDEEIGVVELACVADVHHFGLGGHGDSDKNVEYIEDIVMKCRKGKPLEFILLTHGSKANLKQAAERLYPKYTDQIFFGEEGAVINI